ncbi:hypothetical protein LIER_04730 [Lithospermum erythrorhizon]|uniref:Uncharacterized protein n=1 Tax=Lithospermum erythrorhizon TaxID=34254 RepID=A0AAV3P1W9_LITER
MYEQGISPEFLDRLNPALYDQGIYARECPYSKAASLETRKGSMAIQSSSFSSSESDTTSTSSPRFRVAVGVVKSRKLPLVMMTSGSQSL